MSWGLVSARINRSVLCPAWVGALGLLEATHAAAEKTQATAAGAFANRSSATIAPVPDDWWRLYDDPSLDKLVTARLAAHADPGRSAFSSPIPNVEFEHYAANEPKKTAQSLTYEADPA